MTGESHTQPDGKEFGIQVMQFLNDKCDEWKKRIPGIDFSCYGSPIENTTYKFATKLKERFGVVEGITDRDYVTNSYHVPVFEKINAFDKLALESEFQKLSPGGMISYVETCNLQNNIQAIEEVMKFIYKHIGYAELNTKLDNCQVCNFEGEIILKYDKEKDDYYYECPQCGNRDYEKMNVARRICGYISTTKASKGRLADVYNRIVHLDDHDIEE